MRGMCNDEIAQGQGLLHQHANSSTAVQSTSSRHLLLQLYNIIWLLKPNTFRQGNNELNGLQHLYKTLFQNTFLFI